jgi:hypothetical protein
VIAILLACISAYSLSFALDMLIGGLVGVYPATAFLPVVTWSGLCAVTLLAALKLNGLKSGLWVPFCVFGAVAIIGGIIGTHRYNLSVGGLVLVQAVLIGAAKRKRRMTGTTQERGGPKIRKGHAPTIGPYHLDMNLADLSKLVELTPVEKRALNIAVEFKNERIYHAQPAEFAGASWDIVLGAVDGRVYKVSALLAFDSREQRNGPRRNLDGLLQTTLGTPATATATVIIWDTVDGNVVMNDGEVGGVFGLVLTLTSLQ